MDTPGLTYSEVGATADTQLPADYRYLERRKRIGKGQKAFFAAADALMRWDVHRRAGLRVPENTPAVAVGEQVRMRFGVGPVGVDVPGEVVYVLNELNRRGFAYGTLPGHPEIGEERFVVEIDSNGRVVFEVKTFSRPAQWYTRAAGPVGTAVQRLAARRYTAAAKSWAGKG
ncbi:MAG: DUF1990 domain-containing protein [bacterium]